MAATPSQSAIPNDPATWHFHDRLQVIVHGARQCDVCGPWLTHFAHAMALGDDALAEAEKQRDATIFGKLSAECTKLRQALSTTRAAMNDLHQDLVKSRDELAEAHKANVRLRDEAAQNARDHSPRPRKVPRQRGTSPSPSRFSSYPDIPMLEGGVLGPSLPPPAFLPHIHAATTSLSPVKPLEAPSSSSAHSPTSRGDLFPCLADPSPAVHAPSEQPALPPPSQLPVPPTFVPSRFLPTMGFPSLLPVVVQGENKRLYAADSSVPLDATGDIDFSIHERYVFAIGGWIKEKPAWTTTLVHRDFFFTPQAMTARSLHTLLPMSGVVSGGRNGSLVSPVSDPTTEAAVESLLSNPRAGLYASGYIERIRCTPPELRGDLHNHALKRWKALLRERHEGQDPRKPRAEPPPSAPPQTWKAWLKHSYAASVNGRTFTYRGIPRVGPGYLTAHIEGARAILAFVPLSKKGTTIRGRPREPFLLAAAALLCVPERYPQTLAKLGLTIAPARSTIRYSEASFGSLAAASPRSVACYMASIGVSAEEAELWRAWAAAYVEMELEERPNGLRVEELRRARDRAHARIDDDPRWVLRNVHTDAPGNYNPAVLKSRAARRALAPVEQAPAGTAEAGPSSAAQSTQPDTIEGADVVLKYPDASRGDGDERMADA